MSEDFSEIIAQWFGAEDTSRIICRLEDVEEIEID